MLAQHQWLQSRMAMSVHHTIPLSYLLRSMQIKFTGVNRKMEVSERSCRKMCKYCLYASLPTSFQSMITLEFEIQNYFKNRNGHV